MGHLENSTKNVNKDPISIWKYEFIHFEDL